MPSPDHAAHPLLSDRQAACVIAAAGRIVPADEAPSAAESVEAYLEREATRDLRWALGPLAALADTLDSVAPTAFADRAPTDQDDVLNATPDDMLRPLVRVTMEAYYGGTEQAPPPGWAVTGFRPLPDRVTRIEPDLPAAITATQLRPAYDVVVVGTGAGGGAAAEVLAAAGASVLLVERAQPLPNAALRGNHLRDKRIPVYRPTVGPGPGNPRVVDYGDETVEVDGDGDGFAWGLNAMCLGGGTRIWQAMAWRFMPEDFAMATTYGVPDGSSLADWPIDYAELEPYYDRAEWQLGVSGETGPLTARTPRTRGYPMPATSGGARREVLARAAGRLGWGWGPIPYAINSRPWDGRPACVGCQQCLGHACPVDAKNGTHNTSVPRALATGNADLLMGAQATGIEHRDGEASAVRIAIAGEAECVVRCTRVIVAAGAVETPRLLLASGLGNAHVGRHLHSHGGAMVLARHPERLPPFIGPAHAAATLDFVHDGSTAFGGGVLFDSPSQLPVMAAGLARGLGIASWGQQHKRWMRTGLAHLLGTMSITQEIPSAAARVGIETEVRDAAGMRVARIRPAVHPASARIGREMLTHAVEWLQAAGCEQVVDTHGVTHRGRPAPASEHSCGTARMGDDPNASATDRFGLVHGTRNVTVCDASLHPSNGSVNPTLTIVANAYRIAVHLAADL